jgi:hypothetical protein
LIIKYIADDDNDIRIITGGADDLLRGYKLNTDKTDENLQKTVFLGDEENVLVYYGAIKRTAGVTQGPGGIEKCASLHINSAGTLLAAQSSGKIVEVCMIRFFIFICIHHLIITMECIYIFI